MPGILSFSEMASDEDDSLVTVVTCEGNLTDPDFPYKLSSLVARLRRLLPAGDKPFHVTNVEPWNSVRVTFTIPREAAQRLRQLAQQGDRVLRDLGILSVQIEGDQVISLTIAGRFNEPQEIILRPAASTGEEPRSVNSSNQALFELGGLEGGSPASSSVETTRKNIAQYLSQQGSVANAGSDVLATASTSSMSSPSSESGSSLFSGTAVPSAAAAAATDFKSPNVVAPGSEPIPFPPKTNLHLPARTAPNFGPFPFASMTHAMNTMHGSQGHHQNQTVTSLPSSTASTPSPRFPFSPPPPYPGTSSVGGAFQPVRQLGTNFFNHLHAISASSSLPGTTSPAAAPSSTATSASVVNNLPRGMTERANAALASPLLVNLLQSDVTVSSASPHSSQGCKVFPPPPSEPTATPKRKRKPRKSKERTPSEGTATSLSPGPSPRASPSSVLSSSSVGTPTSADGISLQLFAQPFNIMLPSVPSIPLSPPTLTPPSASPPSLVGQPFTSVESLSAKPLLSGHLSHHHHHHHRHHHHYNRLPTLPSPPPTAPSSASTSNNSGQSSQETELSPWPSPSKRTQHLVNPFTGQLEPMSSEDDDSGDGFLLRDDTFLDAVAGESSLSGQFSEISKSSDVGVAVTTAISTVASSGTVGLIGTSRGGRGTSMPSRGLACSSLSSSITTSSASSSSSASTSSSPSPPATPSSVVAPVSAGSSPSEKIKLRLKLEPKPRIEKEKEAVRAGEKAKADPGTCLGLQYKVDVSFVNIPTSATPRRNSGSGVTAPCLSSSASSVGGCATTTISTSGGISSGGNSGTQNALSPGTAPEPRVPPLHISLRGRNATVVLNPRREDREKAREGTVASLPEAPALVKTQRARSPRGSRQEDSRIGVTSVEVKSPASLGGRRNSASRGGLTPSRGRGAATTAAAAKNVVEGNSANVSVPTELRSVLSPSPPSSAMNVTREKALLSGGCMFVESPTTSATTTTTTTGVSATTSAPSETTASTIPASAAACVAPSQPFPSGPHESKTLVLPAAAVVSSVQIPRQMGKSELELSFVSVPRRPNLLKSSSHSAPPSPILDTNPQSAVTVSEETSDSNRPERENKNEGEEGVAFKDEAKVKIVSPDAPSQVTMHPQQQQSIEGEVPTVESAAITALQSREADSFKSTSNRLSLQKGIEHGRPELPCLKFARATEESSFGPVIVKGVTVVAPCYNNLHGALSRESISVLHEIKEECFSVASPSCQQDEKRDVSGTVSPKPSDVCVHGWNQSEDATKRTTTESSETLQRRTVQPCQSGFVPAPSDVKCGSLEAIRVADLVVAATSKMPSEEVATNLLSDEISREFAKDALRTTDNSAVCGAGPCVSAKSSEIESSSVRVDAALVLKCDSESVEKKREVSYANACCDSETAEQFSLKVTTRNVAVKEEPPDVLSDPCAVECKIGSRGATIKVNCVVESGTESVPMARKLLSPISTNLDSSKAMDDIEVPLGLDVKPSSPKIPRMAKISSLGASEKLRLAAAVGASGVTHLVTSHRGHHPVVDGVCVKPVGCLAEEETENDAVISDDLSSGDTLSHHHTNLHNLLSSTRSSVGMVTISASPSSASPSGSSPDSLHIGTSSEDNGDSSTGRLHGGEGRMHGHHHAHHHNPRGRCSSNGSPYEDSGIDSMDAIMEKLSGGGSPSDPPLDAVLASRDVGAMASSNCSKEDNAKQWQEVECGAKVASEHDVQTVAVESGLDDTNNDCGGSEVESSDSSVPNTEVANPEPTVNEAESGNEGPSSNQIKENEVVNGKCGPPVLDALDEQTVTEEDKKCPEDVKEMAQPQVSDSFTVVVETPKADVVTGEVGDDLVSPLEVDSLASAPLPEHPSPIAEIDLGKLPESDTGPMLGLAESVGPQDSSDDNIVSSLVFEAAGDNDMLEDQNTEIAASTLSSDEEATQLLVFTVQDVNSIMVTENEEHKMSVLEVRADSGTATELQFIHEGAEDASERLGASDEMQPSTVRSGNDAREPESPGDVKDTMATIGTKSETQTTDADSKATLVLHDIDDELQSPVSSSIFSVLSTAASSSFVVSPLRVVPAPRIQIATESSLGPTRTLPLRTASVSSNPVKSTSIVTACSSVFAENGGVAVSRMVASPSPPAAVSPVKVLVSRVCPVSGCASTTSPTVTLTTVVVKSVVVTTPSIVARPTITIAGGRTPITSISQNSGPVHHPAVGNRSTTAHYNSIPNETAVSTVATPFPNVSAIASKSTSLATVASSKASSSSCLAPGSSCNASALPLLTNKTWLVPTVINASNEPPVLSPNPILDAHISTDPPHLQSPFLDLSASANSCAEEEDDAEPFPRLSPAIDLEDGHRDSSISSDHDSECSSHGSCYSMSHMGGSRHFKDDPDDLFMGNISITSGDHNYIVRASRVNRGDRESGVVCDSRSDQNRAEESFGNTNDCDRDVVVVGSNESVLGQLSIEIPPESEGERRSTRCTRSSSRMASPNTATSKQQLSPIVNSCVRAASTSPLPVSSGHTNCHAENDVVRMLPNRSAAKRKREDSEDSESRKIDGEGSIVNNEKVHSRAKSPLVVEMTAHFYSKPVKRKCSENAVELIKACIGVDDAPKRTSNAKHVNMEGTRVHGTGGGGANKAGKAKEDCSKGKSGGCQNAVEGSEESSDDEVTLSELATKARSIRGKHATAADERNVTRNYKQKQNSTKEDDAKAIGANSRSASNNRKDNDGRSSRSGMASQRDPRAKDERVTSRTSRHADRNRRGTPPPRGQERSPQRTSHRSRARDNDRGATSPPHNHPVREDGEMGGGRRKLRSNTSSVSGYYDTLPQKRRRMSRDHR